MFYAFVSDIMSSKLYSNFLNYGNPYIIAITLGLYNSVDFLNENEYKFGDKIRIFHKYSFSVYNFDVTLGLFILPSLTPDVELKDMSIICITI